ncbi:hypothetical protein [Lysobacter enzymogenes]|uniref:hypothetical protein n=1 Tax=Lysobacter enzymogenes TaxID=69 RepID=UPI000F4B0E11|nr:hypothetical protein [Lysobacter enzymogenes]
MIQHRESGWLGSQLLQHGRANADRLTVKPNANAQQVRNSLARDILFMTHSCLRWRWPRAHPATRGAKAGGAGRPATMPRFRPRRGIAAGKACDADGAVGCAPARSRRSFRNGASPPRARLAGGRTNQGIGTARWRTCGPPAPRRKRLRAGEAAP